MTGPQLWPQDAKVIEALFDAVYAAVGDDEPRLVLGDALQERGEPRGEFIALQSRRLARKTKTPSAREKQLAQKHGDSWLGPLAPYLRRPSFHLGFVVAAHVRGGEPDVSLVRSCREWTTIEKLGVRNTPADDVLVLDRLTRLRAVDHVSVELLRRVTEARGRVAWNELRVPLYQGSTDVAALVALGPLLPELATLRLTEFLSPAVALSSLLPLGGSRLLTQLTSVEISLRVDAASNAASALLGQLKALGARVFNPGA